MRPDLITFDCYGTLIDEDLGVARAFQDEAAGRGFTLGQDDVLEAYHEIGPQVAGAEYRPYREVLTAVAERVARRLEWPLPPDRRDFLARSVPSWPPFLDSNPSIERLNAMGVRLGILADVDDDLLADTLHHFTVAFDLMVTAEQTRSYKPSPVPFRRALEEVDGDPDRLLHIAAGYESDVRPARAEGIPVAWVNRAGRPRPPGPAPTVEVRDVAEAVRWLESRPDD